MERKNQLGDLGDNIKMDLKGIGSESVDWVKVAWDMVSMRAPVNTIMILRVS